MVTIVPCNDLDASERFYNRLGFVRRVESGDPDYRILSNRAGGHLHLTRAEKGWLVPGRNPSESIFILKMSMVWLLRCRTSALEDADQRTSHGECMNFAIPDPDETLVRIGWPSHLRNRADEVIE
jgi:hypothetical protein